MKIAVLSDTRLPTALAYPGHGLGKAMLMLAEGLAGRGHDVTLYGAPGSEWDGPLVIGAEETDWVNALAGYDAVLDGGHYHLAARLHPELPIVNLSNDREAGPGARAVHPSHAHRLFHGGSGRVIYYGLDVEAWPLVEEKEGYVAFLAAMYEHKGPHTALQACRQAGYELRMAGPGQPPSGAHYLGALEHKEKVRFLAQARALIVPATIESAGLTCLEAAACGTPVVALRCGGLPEYVADGLTGWLADDMPGLVQGLRRAGEIKPIAAREWVRTVRSRAAMLDAMEAALRAAAGGELW